MSEGSPSEAGIRLDADAALAFAKSGGKPLVAFGISIGGAVAIDLVTRHPGDFSTLILENTFTSLPNVIRDLSPILAPFSLLCSERWNSLEKLRAADLSHLRFLFLSAAKDRTVPPRHMLALWNAIETSPHIKKKERALSTAGNQFVVFADASHNDTLLQPGYASTIVKFLSD